MDTFFIFLISVCTLCVQCVGEGNQKKKVQEFRSYVPSEPLTNAEATTKPQETQNVDNRDLPSPITWETATTASGMLAISAIGFLITFIVIRNSCRERENLQNHDVDITDRNYASQTACWARTRGVRIGAETFLPSRRRPKQSPQMDSSIAILTAISTPEKTKFSVHTKTIDGLITEDTFVGPFQIDSERSIVRVHSDFLWLHGCLEHKEAYRGLTIPEAPPSPDFVAAKESLKYLEEEAANGISLRSPDVKREVRSKYEDAFKETVGAHEAFLKALAANNVLRNDIDFNKFLKDSNLDTAPAYGLPPYHQLSVDGPPTYDEAMRQAPLPDGR